MQFKKIRVYYNGGAFTMDKLARDTHFNGEPDGEVNQIRNTWNGTLNG